ncbi:uncharacterized protein LOC102804210 [Saccoglossus kowalevskii]
MRRVFQIGILCCLVIAFWEIHSVLHALATVLVSVKPIRQKAVSTTHVSTINNKTVDNNSTHSTISKDVFYNNTAKDKQVAILNVTKNNVTATTILENRVIEKSNLNTTIDNVSVKKLNSSVKKTTLVNVTPKSIGSGLETDTNPNQPSGKRYLFPLHCDNNGPNVQYGVFRMGIAFAMYYNRTVVENTFGGHWTSAQAGAEVVTRRRFVNETFDLPKIQKLVDVATVEEYQRECNGVIDNVLMHPFIKKPSLDEYSAIYSRKRGCLQTRYGVKMPFQIPQTREEADALMSNPPDTRCLGIFGPGLDTKWEFPGQDKYLRTVDQHLQNPPNIMKMAKDVGQRVCDGDPYMALHWRNRSGETCGHAAWGWKCADIPKVVAVNLTAESAAIDIHELMKKRNISCIYVALPSFSGSILKILKDANIARVKSLVDITTDEYPDIMKISHDGYLISRLEQEICSRSKVFMATLFSSWSRFAYRLRDSLGLETQILHNFVRWKAPGVSLKRK